MEETACRNKALQQKYRFSGLACRETHTEQAKRMFWTSSEFFRASAFLFPTGSRFSVALAFFLPTESCFSMALAVLLPAGFRRNCPPGIYREHNGPSTLHRGWKSVCRQEIVGENNFPGRSICESDFLGRNIWASQGKKGTTGMAAQAVWPFKLHLALRRRSRGMAGHITGLAVE